MMEIRYGPFEHEFHAIVRYIGHMRYADNLRAVDVQMVRTLQDGRPVIRGRVSVNDSGFKTKPRDTDYLAPGARRSWSGRRAGAACWHAYRDVLAELFRRYPHAVVLTGMARYEGREGFERSYPATAYHEIGSQYQPTTMPELCDCATNDNFAPTYSTPEPTRLTAIPRSRASFDLFPDITARIEGVERELSEH